MLAASLETGALGMTNISRFGSVPERINGAASKADEPRGYERSNRSTSSSLIYLSVAQMVARLLRG